MSSGIQPDKLLVQAKVLAGVGAGRGRPRSVDLRRAVSSAYYALFHELVGCAVDQAMPAASFEDRAKAAKWFNHSDVKKACEWIAECATKPTPSNHIVEKGIWTLFSTSAGGARRHAVPSDLQFVADTFVALIAARHAADYDHEAHFPRAAAQSHVRSAERAISVLRANIADAYVRKFLVLLLACSTRLVRG